jgi:hypothetical protein
MKDVIVKLDLQKSRSLRKATVRLSAEAETIVIRPFPGKFVVCPSALSDAVRREALEWMVRAYTAELERGHRPRGE